MSSYFPWNSVYIKLYIKCILPPHIRYLILYDMDGMQAQINAYQGGVGTNTDSSNQVSTQYRHCLMTDYDLASDQLHK